MLYASSLPLQQSLPQWCDRSSVDTPEYLETISPHSVVLTVSAFQSIPHM